MAYLAWYLFTSLLIACSTSFQSIFLYTIPLFRTPSCNILLIHIMYLLVCHYYVHIYHIYVPILHYKKFGSMLLLLLSLLATLSTYISSESTIISINLTQTAWTVSYICARLLIPPKATSLQTPPSLSPPPSAQTLRSRSALYGNQLLYLLLYRSPHLQPSMTAADLY